MATGVNFKCPESCGVCCREVSVSKEFYEAHKPSWPHKKNEHGNYVHADVEACAWLNKEGRCSIYNDRPEACKRFGDGRPGSECPFMTPDGAFREPSSRDKILAIAQPARKMRSRWLAHEEIKKIQS